MIKYIDGNILDATENIICQQVNCQGVMGAGLAKQIRDKYPEVYPAYVRFVNESDKSKLLGQVQTVLVGNGKVIANLFGQYNYGRDKQYTDYQALWDCFYGIKQIAEFTGDSIAMPYGIGCGLAGGNWDIVRDIIEQVFLSSNIDVTIYRKVI